MLITALREMKHLKYEYCIKCTISITNLAEKKMLLFTALHLFGGHKSQSLSQYCRLHNYSFLPFCSCSSEADVISSWWFRWKTGLCTAVWWSFCCFHDICKLFCSKAAFSFALKILIYCLVLNCFNVLLNLLFYLQAYRTVNSDSARYSERVEEIAARSKNEYWQPKPWPPKSMFASCVWWIF